MPIFATTFITLLFTMHHIISRVALLLDVSDPIMLINESKICHTSYNDHVYAHNDGYHIQKEYCQHIGIISWHQMVFFM